MSSPPGWTVEEVLAGMTSVAEGVTTAPVLIELARRYGVEMPIAETVVALLDGRIAGTDAITMLMNRRPQTELHGLVPAACGR